MICDGVHRTVDELFTCKDCEHLFTPEIDESTNWEEEYNPEREQEIADEIRQSLKEDGEVN